MYGKLTITEAIHIISAPVSRYTYINTAHARGTEEKQVYTGQNAPLLLSIRTRSRLLFFRLLVVNRAFFKLRNLFLFERESVALATTFSGSRAMTARAHQGLLTAVADSTIGLKYSHSYATH